MIMKTPTQTEKMTKYASISKDLVAKAGFP